MKGSTIILWVLLLPMAGGLLSCVLGKLREGERTAEKNRLCNLIPTGITAAVFTIAVFLAAGQWRGDVKTLRLLGICGRDLTFTVDGFRALYVSVASFAWLTASVFYVWYGSHDRHAARYQAATLITLSCTLGVLLSADLFTTFVFFEGMSLVSYLWVVHEQTAEAIRASKTYLAVAVIGGLVLLMGLFLLENTVGTLDIEELQTAYWIAGANGSSKTLFAAGLCLLFGFGAKAGAWPLHIWLPKAHPEAPASASALLSGILTKTGVFGVLILCGRIFLCHAKWGNIILVLGVITMLVGALRAVGSIDIKHMLACSSVSQIGFILVGAGTSCLMADGNGAAIAGSILHMLNHSAFKLILFTAAGIAVHTVHTRDLNKLRGFGRNRYGLMIIMLTASLGIGGIPGFSGYISKTLIHETLAEVAAEAGFGYRICEYLFLFAGGCTVAYMAKLFVVLFLRKPSEEVLAAEEKQGSADSPRATMVLLGITAAFVFLCGTLPEVTMVPLGVRASRIAAYVPMHHAPQWFSWECLAGSLISIVAGVVIYFAAERPLVCRKLLPLRETPQYVDRMETLPTLEDNVYRPLLLTVLPAVFGTLMRGLEVTVECLARAVFVLCKSVLVVMDKIVDALVLLLRRSALRPVVEQRSITIGEAICNPIGHVGNGFRRLWNATFGRKKPKDGDCVAAVNRARESLTESVKLVSRSLSYGLMAFCIGLLVLLAYLLWSLR